jgi:two-component system, NarL family, response regulator DesR
VTTSNPPHALTRRLAHRSRAGVAEPCRRRPQERTLPASDGVPAPETSTIRILLVEDMSLVRGALVALLGAAPDIEVVDQTGCDERVASAAVRLRPDVEVVDVDAPCAESPGRSAGAGSLHGNTGLAMIRMLQERVPACRILALAVAARPGQIRRALDANVMGMLDKDAAPDRLAEAIRRVSRGERMVDPNLAVAALCMAPNPLTRREVDVLRLAADGASALEIAKELSLSGGTVRNYLSRVVTKTGARSRIDAIRIARDAAWL